MNRSIWNEGNKTDPTGVIDSKKNQWIDSGKSWTKKNFVSRSKDKREFVRPRWPYDMRPSAEKYMCVIVIR